MEDRLTLTSGTLMVCVASGAVELCMTIGYVTNERNNRVMLVLHHDRLKTIDSIQSGCYITAVEWYDHYHKWWIKPFI